MPRFALGRECALGIGEAVVACPAWGVQNFLEVGCEIRVVPTLVRHPCALPCPRPVLAASPIGPQGWRHPQECEVGVGRGRADSSPGSPWGCGLPPQRVPSSRPGSPSTYPPPEHAYGGARCVHRALISHQTGPPVSPSRGQAQSPVGPQPTSCGSAPPVASAFAAAPRGPCI